MEVKLILHDNLFILGKEPKDSFLDDDILIYIKDKEKAKILKESEYIDIGDIIDDIYKIAKIGKLYNKASNIYFKLDEKNKEKFKDIKDDLIVNSIIPMIAITYLILYQIKRILKSKALGHITNELEKNELDIAWNFFIYLLKGMPAGSELIDKIDKDEFNKLYLAMSFIQ
jgi:hypothetical protein